MESVVDPARKHVTGDEEGVFDSDHQTSAVSSGDFGLDDWHGHGEETNTKTLDGATSDEASKVWCEDLDKGREEVDEGSDTNAKLTTGDSLDIKIMRGISESGKRTYPIMSPRRPATRAPMAAVS